MSEKRENPDAEQQPQSLTRRKFLKLTGLAGLTLTAHALGLRGSTPQEISAQPPTGEFTDLLSEEDLRAAHIRINQAPKVKLFLRKGVFDFPLFENAREGKISEVVISLADHPSLSWNASEKLPADARLVLQAQTVDPKEHPEKYWQGQIQAEEEHLNRWTEWLEKDQRMLVQLESGILEKIVGKDLAQAQLYATEGFDREYWQKRAQELSEELEKIRSGQKRQELDEETKRDQFFIEQSQRELAILNNRPKAVAREAEENYVAGLFARLDQKMEFSKEYQQDYPAFVQRYEDLWQNPRFRNKVYLFVAVAGEGKPQVQESYPRPEEFRSYPGVPRLIKAKGEGYRWEEPFTAGTVLRHEVSHWASSDKSASEYEAETKVFTSIAAAWRRYSYGGEDDSSGYPFVFRTSEGIIVTRRRPSGSGRA